MKQWIVITEEVRRYRVEYFVEAKSAEAARDSFRADGNETEQMVAAISQTILDVEENK